MGGAIQPVGRQRVLLYLLVLTGMVLYENVIQVIIVKVKQQTKSNVNQDHMLPEEDPLRVLNARPVPILTRLVPFRVKIVTLVPTNRNPMLRDVFQCKKDSIVQDQQPKWNVQRVKEEMVVVHVAQHAKNAIKEDFKRWREKPYVSIVPADGILQPVGRLDASQYHRGRTL